MAKNVMFNMAAAAILDLLDTSSEGKSRPVTLFLMSVSNCANGANLGFLVYVNFDRRSVCRTPFSVFVSNLVQIRLKMAELWPFN